jgi:hypothetical protein
MPTSHQKHFESELDEYIDNTTRGLAYMAGMSRASEESGYRPRKARKGKARRNRETDNG